MGGVKIVKEEGTYSGRGKFEPLSPKTTQIQMIISRVKEELIKALFSAFDAAFKGLFQ